MAATGTALVGCSDVSYSELLGKAWAAAGGGFLGMRRRIACRPAWDGVRRLPGKLPGIGDAYCRGSRLGLGAPIAGEAAWDWGRLLPGKPTGPGGAYWRGRELGSGVQIAEAPRRGEEGEMLDLRLGRKREGD